MRQAKIKKSRRHNNRPVQVVSRKNGSLEVTMGYLKGYLGNDILVDTGSGLYDHVAMGNAPGSSLVLPLGVQIRIGKPAIQSRGTTKAAPVFNDAMLPPRWEDNLPPAYETSRYPEAHERFSVSESYWQ